MHSLDPKPIACYYIEAQKETDEYYAVSYFNQIYRLFLMDLYWAQVRKGIPTITVPN
jgi:hypothetical protein